MKVSQPVSITKFIKANELTFEIPVYQRNYAWDIDNCDQLFDDVLKGFQEGRKHYFGNIVYYEASEQLIIGFDRYILIDGQQRITSTMLLLAAIRDEEGDASVRSRLTSTYLTNAEADEKIRVKLKQVESDRSVYDAIITGDTEDALKSTVVYRNYNRFRRLVKEAKADYGLSTTDLLTGIEYLEIIAIDLESDKADSESPQVIFESINATGKPLSTADLLRNFLLLEIGVDEQKDYYEKYWLVIEGNVGNDNISDFIRRYITLVTHEEIKKGTEYKEFKRNYKDYFDNSKEAIKLLARYSKYYQWVKQPEVISKLHPQVSKTLQDLDELRLDPATPAIMWLLEKLDSGSVSDKTIVDTLDVVASWAFRARVTGIISAAEISQILTIKLLDFLNNKTEDVPFDEHILFELSNYRLRDIYPSDEMFRDAFIRYNFYKNYRRYVQQKLSSSISNDQTEILLESIEHIMPQSIRKDKWPGIGPGEHVEWVNTIGNLTPLNLPDNISNSNHSFDDKLENIKNSDWQITREVMFHAADGWGISQIKKRAENLADNAAGVWRGPLPRTREIELTLTNNQLRSKKIVRMIEGLSLPHIFLDREMSRDVWVRFHTESMNKIIPPLGDASGSWGNGNAYYYEIINRGTRLQISLAPETGSNEQLRGQEKVLEVLNKSREPGRWVTKSWKLDQDDDGNVDEDDLRIILEETIPQFEALIVGHDTSL